MKIVLAAVESELADAWEFHCGDLECVSVHRGSILDVRCDAVVSPANSFGFMDGGIDRLYSYHFGWQVQERLQELIRSRHHGELLVGLAELVETDDARIPFLIAAPTMRVPMILRDTVNPYLAVVRRLAAVAARGRPVGELRGVARGVRRRDGRVPGAGHRGRSGRHPHLCSPGARGDRAGHPGVRRIPSVLGRSPMASSVAIHRSCQ